MPPKQKVPAPIDRPLSRAYLREFSGWSTAFPPGLSEPTSLRVMENTMVNRDGSLRIRPGLKYLSYDLGVMGYGRPIVGTHEAFFLNDGSRAYLFAVRETDDTVGFRVLTFPGGNPVVKRLSEAGIAFSVPVPDTDLNFSQATGYVKYLQIDNKILALSDAGEPMRIFTVGEVKTAKRLYPVEAPTWNANDKLTVVHPAGSWVLGGATTVRTNRLLNPSFETGVNNWTVTSSYTTLTQASQPQGNVGGGAFGAAIGALPTQTNKMPNPLAAPGNNNYGGISGWVAGAGTQGIISAYVGAVNREYLKATSAAGAAGREAWVYSPEMSLTPGTAYRVALDYRVDAGITEKLAVRYYDNTGVQLGAEVALTFTRTGDRLETGTFTPPGGANTARLFVGGVINSTVQLSFLIGWVMVTKNPESTAWFEPNNGGGHYLGGVGNSESVNYPGNTAVLVSDKTAVANVGLVEDYTGSMYFQTGSDTGQGGKVALRWYDSTGAVISTSAFSAQADTYNGGAYGWGRVAVTMAAPNNATHVALVVQVENQDWSNIRAGSEIMYVDAGMIEQASAAGAYFDGSRSSTASKTYAWSGTAHASTSTETTAAAAVSIPGQATPTVNTLIHSTPATNTYSFAFFYTFSNEVGESAPSQMSVTKTQRAWTQWKWQKPNAASEPTGGQIADPALMADQLVAYMPQTVFNQAVAQGARLWSLYLLTWSDQEATPVEGYLVGTKEIPATPSYQRDSWIRVTSQAIGSASESLPLPSAENRVNYSDPGAPSQGVVAADRLVLVHDPTRAGVIRWTSARAGEYLNFTPNKGGGYKTLTSGNLYVPASVKLWQNPESKDTLTVLCQGVDGYSSAYYMAPAQIASQSDTTNIMAFEETTATPGTVSPYGVEVLNNALYHPLENELMKSTASNYNISHKPMTDPISNMWAKLASKDKIVSSQMDNRLYYIVHNPAGEPLETGCWGNEIWVFDTGSEKGTWSRWLIQAHSLRKIEVDGQLVMSVVRPDGIYCLDPNRSSDEYVEAGTRSVLSRPIPWKIETNTQGANRAHDAWAHLQQVGIVLGSFTGHMRYGVRGHDQHGYPVEAAKVVQDDKPVPSDGLPFDLEDYLRVARDMKEWRFYAESVQVSGELQPSSGQISLVQYRYTPVSVNVGYEYGTVESFEYTRNESSGNNNLYVNGIPVPAIETRRP